MSFADIFNLLTGNFWIYAAAFVVVLSILVFVHEFGHYIVARWCGVRVEVFSIGFGRELFGRDDKHGTRWKVCLVPLGGYVKLFGDVDPDTIKPGDGTPPPAPMNPSDRAVAFFAKPVWKRALVVAAGPGINYLFAFIVFVGLFITVGQPVTPPLAAAIGGDSAAREQGFQPHDLVLSIDGKSIRDFEEIRQQMMISLDQPKKFTVQRDGAVIDIMATPRRLELEDRFGFKHTRGILGLISPRQAVEIKNIKAIDGKPVADEDAAKKTIVAAFNKTVTIDLGKPDGTTESLIIHPKAAFNENIMNAESEESKILFLAKAKENTMVSLSLGGAIAEAARQIKLVTFGTLEALGQMVMGTRSPQELGGVIRIGALAGDMAQQGLIAFIMFTALLSVNLGLVNLFPIPMLDGGHLVFYFFESILGRPVSEPVQEFAFRVGLVFIVGIMVFANLNDIVQLIL